MLPTNLLTLQKKFPLKQLFIFICVAMIIAATMAYSEDREKSRYDEAWALYQQGPQKANQVIALLQEEIKENPDNDSAHLLLGITFFGTEQFDAALRQFDIALDLGEKQNVKRPRTILLKARTLKMLRRSAEAKDLLDINAASFTDADKETKKEYETLFNDVATAQLKTNYLEMASEAIRIAGAILRQDMTKWLAIPLAQKEWPPLTSDKDLSHFLTVKLDVPDLTTIILFPTGSQNIQSLAIYFSKRVPIGYLKEKSGKTDQAKNQITEYVSLKDAGIVPANYANINFDIGSIESDNGVQLFVFKTKTIDIKKISTPVE
jgi:tetratricopeptide (TPR) repeat protein